MIGFLNRNFRLNDNFHFCQTIVATSIDRIQSLSISLNPFSNTDQPLPLSEKNCQSSSNIELLKKYEQSYWQAKSIFSDAENLLKNEVYGSKEKNPVLNAEKIQLTLTTALNGILGMQRAMKNFIGAPNIYTKIQDALKEDCKYLSWLMEDWINLLNDFVANEKRELKQLLRKGGGKTIEHQLVILENELEKIEDHSRGLFEKLNSLDKALLDVFRHLIAPKSNEMNPSKQAEKNRNAHLPLYGSPAWAELVKQRPEQGKNFLQKIWQNLTDIESWSDQTKKFAHAFFIVMQISGQVIDFNHRIKQFKQESQYLRNQASEHISEEELQRIDKETALLGIMLSDKFEASKNPALFNKFTKKLNNKTRRTFQEILQGYQRKPTTEEIDLIGHLFRTEQIFEKNRESHSSSFFRFDEPFINFNGWWKPFEDTQEIVQDHSQPFHSHFQALSKEIRLFKEIIFKSFPQKRSTDTMMTIINPSAKICHSPEFSEKKLGILMSPFHAGLALDPLIVKNCGKKHGNIVRQKKLIDFLSLSGMDVPFTICLCSDTILQFLQKEAPKIFEYRQNLKELFDKHESNPTFLEQESVSKYIAAIDHAILKAFEMHDAFERIHFPGELIAWLSTVKGYLTVRSTSTEDQAKGPNAGGHESPAYILPDKKSICEAIGKVIRSYFGINSLRNRINSGQNPFEQDLQLSVDIQKMIGEPIGGSIIPNQIPVSIVIFTDETAYTNNEFRLMRLSAGYGYGGSIVGNCGIDTDTVMIVVSDADPSRLQIYYHNALKTHRLAPVDTDKGIRLEWVENPPELKTKPALNRDQLVNLYHWGVVAAKFFGSESDMEIVILEDQTQALQLREIYRPPLKPTFLDKKKLIASPDSPIKKMLRAEILIPGKSSLMTIDHKEQILISRNLEQAEKNFQEGIHGLIIVQETEPVNSHPVVNFSSLGIPCLIGNINEVERIVNEINDRISLVVCMQTAFLYLWDKNKADPAEFISEGFAVHPASISISLPIKGELKTNRPAEKVPQEIGKILNELKEKSSKKEVVECLKEIEEHPWIKSFRDHVNDLISLNSLKTSSKEILQIRVAISAFFEQFDNALAEIKASASLQNDGKRLKFLFWNKVLESLLIEAPPNQAVNRFSFGDIKILFIDAMDIIEYRKQLSHEPQLVDLLFIGHKSYSEKRKKAWRNFLLESECRIEKGDYEPETIAKFRSMLTDLEKADVLDYWLNFVFSYEPPSAGLQDLLTSYSHSDSLSIQNSLLFSNEMHYFNSRVHLFSEQATFEIIWLQLQEVLKNFLENSLKSEMRNLSSLAKIVDLKNKQMLVDVFDRAIKTVKIGFPNDNELKLIIFQNMLEPFLSLLINAKKDLIEKKLSCHKNWPVDVYLDKLKYFLKELPNNGKNQWRPSSDFSVWASLLGALTEFSRHYPQSLEDLFTLIHQNLLLWLSLLNKELLSDLMLQNSSLPDSFKACMFSIDSKFPMKTGFDLSHNKISIQYNIPLRNHSARLTLIYEKLQPATLKAQFLGNSRGRWQFLNSITEILSEPEFRCISMSQRSQWNENELTIYWQIEDSRQIESAITIFDYFCKFSIEERNEPAFYNNLGSFFKNAITKEQEVDLTKNILAKIFQLNSEQESPVWAIYLKLIKTLISKEADLYVKVAEEMSHSDIPMVKNEAFFLFELLLSYLEDYSIAIKAIEFNHLYPDLTVQRQAYLLLKKVTELKTYPEALQMAQTTVKNEDIEIRRNSLRIIGIFLREKQGVEIAHSIIENFLESSQVEKREEAYWLYAELLISKNGHGLVRQAVDKAMNEPDPAPIIRIRISNMIKQLVYQKQIHPFAFREMDKFVEGHDVKEAVFDILNMS